MLALLGTYGAWYWTFSWSHGLQCLGPGLDSWFGLVAGLFQAAILAPLGPMWSKKEHLEQKWALLGPL